MNEKEMSLPELLEHIDRLCRTGNRKALAPLLRHLLGNRRLYYGESIRQGMQDALSDALMKALLLELDEEEEVGIEAAELSYIGIGSVLREDPPQAAELYKRRLLLLHHFGDYFTDAIITLFLEKFRAGHLLEARSLALECLERMRTYDMLWLEEHVPGSIDTDEQLSDACNAFETGEPLSDEELQEAETLHNALYAFLKAKYKS